MSEGYILVIILFSTWLQAWPVAGCYTYLFRFSLSPLLSLQGNCIWKSFWSLSQFTQSVLSSWGLLWAKPKNYRSRKIPCTYLIYHVDMYVHVVSWYTVKLDSSVWWHCQSCDFAGHYYFASASIGAVHGLLIRHMLPASLDRMDVKAIEVSNPHCLLGTVERKTAGWWRGKEGRRELEVV